MVVKSDNDNDPAETIAMVANGDSNGDSNHGDDINDEGQQLETFKINDNNADKHTSNGSITYYKQEAAPDMTIRQIWVNLITISVAFLLLFSAFLSFGNLQSTVNQEEGLGTVGVSVIYISMFITTLLFPPLVMSRFSLKWIAVVSMVTYVVYMATGYYPSWYTIVPASVCVGCGAAHLWIANSAFITQLARRYAAQTKKDINEVVSHFFGIFFVALCSNNIWGNLISSLVLNIQQPNTSDVADNVSHCGAEFCAFDTGTNDTVIIQPTKKQFYQYTSIIMALGVAAIACLVVFMKSLPPESKPVSITHNAKSIWNLLLRDNRQLLLILPTLYRGMMQGFIAGDFTIAFVSCPLGVDMVGFVMVTFGVVGAIASYTFGKLSKYTGLYPLFCVAFVIHTTLCITMLLWTPTHSRPFVIYIIAGLWSIGDAAYLTLVAVIYSLYFEDKLETALSCFRCVDAFGLALTFSYSAFLCTRYKIAIVQAVLISSQICLTLFFVKFRKPKTGIER